MYKEICEKQEFLSHMNADLLSALLCRDDLRAPSEKFVLRSVTQWIKYKKEERMDVAAQVIGAVRMGLVDIKDVIEELDTEEMQVIPEMKTLLHEAFMYNHRPSRSSAFALAKGKPRSTSMVGEKDCRFLSFSLHKNVICGTSFIIFPQSFEQSFVSACHSTPTHPGPLVTSLK